MNHGATPGGDAPHATTPDGAAARGARSDATAVPEPPADPESSAPPDGRRRLQALAGMTVHGSDGKTIGRVRDIYLEDSTGELAAITVMPRQLSARSVLIPAAAIGALPEEPVDGTAGSGTDGPGTDDPDADVRDAHDSDHALHLLVDTATAKAGARPPLTLHATPQDLQAASAALHLGERPGRR